MGCWNETCGLSNLPILCGDKVKLFVLSKSNIVDENEGGGYCYSDELWSPLCNPITGYYNDYGGIENIKMDNSAKEALFQIKFKWIPTFGEYDHPSPLETMELEEVINWIERGQVYYKDDDYMTKYKLGIFMVLYDIYEELIDKYRKRGYGYPETSYANALMNELRKTWIPQSGKGSQLGSRKEDNEIFRKLFNISLEVLDKREKEGNVV